MLLRAVVLTLAALLAAAPRGEAWGFTGHRMVNRKAVGTLPDPLQALFAANADYVSEHSIDPDLWRHAGRPGETPNHFLDMDAFGAPPFDAIPRAEADHLRRHGADAVSKGRLPWRVAEVYRELVAAFRERDAGRVLERAAVLGHYVGDGHVPLHAVVNYDGQLTGQTGVHARWESDLVERFARQLEDAARPAPARRIADPLALTFDVLLESFRRAEPALAADRQSAGPRDIAGTPEDERYDDGYYSRLYEREGRDVRERLAEAASAVGSLWLSAWEEAGRPALDPSFRFPYVRGQSRALLVSLDGASAGLLDDAVARGVMPHLARLRASGATARGSLTTLPAKTAAAHAALFTGAWGDRNGIAANEVFAPDAALTEWESGYASTHLRAEPIWVTAARQGLDATAALAPLVHPFGPYLGERRFGGNFGWNLTLIDGYQNLELDDAVYTAKDLSPQPAESWLGELPRREGEARQVALQVAGTRIDGLLYDDPVDPAGGFDTLYLTLDRDAGGGVSLKPAPSREGEPLAFGGLRLKAGGGEAAAYFRLFALSPDGAEILLYRSRVHLLRASRPPLEPLAFEQTGGFVGNGANVLYENGALGPPLWEGGDGTAERRYLETVELSARQFRRATEFALSRTSWDLFVTYFPFPDEALHLWLGRLDPSLAGHDAALAARLRPFLDRILRLADDHVRSFAAHVGADTLVAVVSDHGQVGTNRIFRPNVALARAGLVASDARGRVDLSRTRALYVPAGFVLVNGASREGGIVTAGDQEAVRRQVVAALRNVRDPASGKPVATALDAHGEAPPGIGRAGGDLYLSLAPGYRLSAALSGEVVEPAPPKGEHLANPERPAMHGAFTVAGPGVATGADLGVIRQIDVAPTLCALLGIDPPAQATGVVVTKALGRVR